MGTGQVAPDVIPYDQEPAPQGTPAPAPDVIPYDDNNPAPDVIPYTDEEKQSQQPGVTGDPFSAFMEGLVPSGFLGSNEPSNFAMAKGLPPEPSQSVTPEDIQRNKQEHPIASAAGEITGDLAMAAALPIGEIGALGRVGQLSLKSGIANGLISAKDQANQYLLGQQNDPKSAVGNILLNAGIGTLIPTFAIKSGEVGTKIAQKIGIKGASNLTTSFLSGWGHAVKFPTEKLTSLSESMLSDEAKQLLDPGMFKLGQFAHHYSLPTITAGVASHVIPETSPTQSWFIRFGAGKLGEYIQKLVGKNISQSAREAAGNVFFKAASSNTTQGLDSLLERGIQLGNGQNLADRAVNALFNQGPQDILNKASSEQKREQLDEQSQNYSTEQPPGMAEGGEVGNSPGEDPVAKAYPEMAMGLSTARGRILGHIKSQRPNNNPTRLPYDSVHENPQAKREYNKVLDLAIHPLNVMGKIKNGSLTPEYMNHFTALHPEAYGVLKNRIHDKIAENRLKDRPKPPHHVRQSLSLFLGQDMDSSLTQPNIAAAQNVFAQQKAQRAQPPNTKTSLNKTGQNYATPEQSREKALNKT